MTSKYFISIQEDISNIKNKVNKLEVDKINKNGDTINNHLIVNGIFSIENKYNKQISFIAPDNQILSYKLKLPELIGLPGQVMILDNFQNLQWTYINPTYDQSLNTNNDVSFNKIIGNLKGNVNGDIIKSNQPFITELGKLNNLKVNNTITFNDNYILKCPLSDKNIILELPNKQNNKNELLISDNNSKLTWLSIDDFFKTLNLNKLTASSINGIIDTNKQLKITELGIQQNFSVLNNISLVNNNNNNINIKIDSNSKNYDLILPSNIGTNNQTLLLNNNKLSWIDFPNQELHKNSSVLFKSLNSNTINTNNLTVSNDSTSINIMAPINDNLTNYSLVLPSKLGLSGDLLYLDNNQLRWKKLIEFNQSLNTTDNPKFNTLELNDLKSNNINLKIKNDYINVNYLALDKNNNVIVKSLEQLNFNNDKVSEYKEITELKSSEILPEHLLKGIIIFDTNNLNDGVLLFPSYDDIIIAIQKKYGDSITLDGFVFECLFNNYSGGGAFYKKQNNGLLFISTTTRPFVNTTSSRLVVFKVNLSKNQILVI